MDNEFCKLCGSQIPSGQSGICSMCYGDPSWGSDGYYQGFLDAAAEIEECRRQLEEEEQWS